MGSHVMDLWVLVRDALLARTDLKTFVESMCSFAAEDRLKGLHWWLEWELAVAQLARFDGTKEELEGIMNYVHGKRTFLRKCGHG
jgi:hypothetical protein